MVKYNLRNSVYFLVVFISLNISLLAQIKSIEVPIAEQIRLADQAVEAKVVSSESFWDTGHQNIYTKHLLKVYKIFKGSASTTLELIVPGGRVGLDAEKVSHSILLKPGDLGFFILKRKQGFKGSEGASENKFFESVGGDQSFFRYDLNSSRAANHFMKINTISEDLYRPALEASGLSESIVVSEFDLTNQTKNGNFNRTSLETQSVDSFSTSENTAGTGAVLTITGQGFGHDMGKISFSNSDYGGFLQSDALVTQILSWSEEEIKVEIPDFAGTGNFSVKTSDGSIIESIQPLDIDYAQTNREYDLGDGTAAFNTRHISTNGNGGYTFTLNQNFANSDAVDAFKRAIESWSCQTGMNWVVESEQTIINSDVDDGINLIAFDENNRLPAAKLAQCRSRYKACYEDDELRWYVTEIDIIFNDREDWYFGEDDPASDRVDLESVALHELGHGHQLNHVVDRDKVMHYSFVPGDKRRVLSTHDLQGGQSIMLRSKTTAVCGRSIMTNASCSTLSTSDTKNEGNISLFPNPASSSLTIRNNNHSQIEKIEMFNINGALVRSFNIKGTQVIRLDVSTFAQGMYLLKFQSDMGYSTQKLIIK